MISLTVTASETQVIFGIPQYLSVSSDSGIIYYTLDGSIPTEDSLVAEENIFLPTNDFSFVVKIKAISGSDESEVFSGDYGVEVVDIRNTRRGNESGVVVITEGDTAIESMAFDSEGNSAKETSVEFSDLEIKASTTMFEKSYAFDREETLVDFINFSTKDDYIENYFKTSYVNNNNNFDPKSKVIIINGRTQEEKDSQSVLLINRPYDTFNPSSKFYVENENTFEQIISGNLVRSVYNSHTGALTSYYYESKESKWIISNQKIEPKTLNISNGRPKKFVYKWVKDPVMSKIF